jgi:hypothetical protein
LLEELYTQLKIEELLKNPLSRATQIKLSEWSTSVIDLTESHFNTFGFTMLHYQLACVLSSHLSAELVTKDKEQVSV